MQQNKKVYLAAHMTYFTMEGGPQPPQKQHIQQQQEEIQMTKRYRQRLQMIANYENFHPQVIACSDPIRFPTADGTYKHNDLATTTSKPQHSGFPSSSRTTIESTKKSSTTPLGAIAGSDGIVVFRWDAPHIPMLVLSYTNVATTKSSSSASSPSPSISSTGGITSLAFSPSNQHIDSKRKKGSEPSPIYLAAVRGSSILIWDVTGHTIQPLQSRLGMTPSLTSSVGAGSSYTTLSSTITSMTWITVPGSSSTNLHIAATSQTMAGIWDLGSPSGPSSGISNNSSSIQRPCIRFADASKYQEYSPYIQIACSNSASINGPQCAILSASGMVRIYNLHVSAGSINIVIDHPIHQLEACHSAGIGMSYIALRNNSTCHNGWVTWGLDASNTDPIVKVWMDHSISTKPIKEDDNDGNASHPLEYRLMGQCTTPNLACARVCPSPITNTIVTVRFNDLTEGVNSLTMNWRTDVWRLAFADTAVSNDTTELMLCDSNDNEDDDYGLATDSTLEHITTFNGPSDDDNFESVLVGKELMALRAAELTLLPSSEKHQKDEIDLLLLCCLTENGFLTTHTIPEVNSKQKFNLDKKGNIGAIIPIIDRSTKLFPANAELTIADAASSWGNSTDASTNIAVPIDRTTFLERSVAFSTGMINSATRETATVPPGSDISPSSYYASGAPFPEMQSHGALLSDVDVLNSFSTDTIVDSDQGDVDMALRNATKVMAKIETDRIPCPRLCGASFSSGVGGITIFNNGGVKRMWEWFEKRDPTRMASVPGLIGEPSLQDLFSQTGKQFHVGDEHAASGILKSSSPRTLNDLVSMTLSAKDAQWGQHEESGALSTEFPTFGNDFFDDDSNASSDSGAEHFEESTEKIDYFAQIKDKNTQAASEALDVSKIVIPAGSDVASDMLTPSVKVSKAYIKISLNSQSVELAQCWNLGDFDVSRGQQGPVRRSKPKTIPFPPHVNAMNVATNLSTHHFSKQELPSYRSLLPASPDRKDDMQRGKHVEYESVHGGAYSVRPNMQESMVFLRKLFTQQHQPDGKTPFPNLLSPPDDPMLASKVTALRKNVPDPPVDSLLSTKGTIRKTVNSDTFRIGVHTVPADPVQNGEELKKMEELCLHNAKICEALGEMTKMGSWQLVAKIVQSKRIRTGRGLDGWGNALGGNLIGSLLSVYEKLGDVQMLSSLVCVLRDNGQHTTCETNKREWLFLPNDQNSKYDNYIRRYSELLYGWGLLTKRAELVKHLTQPILFDDNIDNEAFSGISFDIECPQCSGSTHFGYCRPCNDFSFRCTICDNAVRGLFTVCCTCGHGGHVTHITDWFSRNNKCPTGCGCICKLSSSSLEN